MNHDFHEQVQEEFEKSLQDFNNPQRKFLRKPILVTFIKKIRSYLQTDFSKKKTPGKVSQSSFAKISERCLGELSKRMLRGTSETISRRSSETINVEFFLHESLERWEISGRLPRRFFGRILREFFKGINGRLLEGILGEITA